MRKASISALILAIFALILSTLPSSAQGASAGALYAHENSVSKEDLMSVFKTAELMGDKIYVEASELGLVGKMMPTSNPYWRVDTTRYKGFTPGENHQVRSGAGMAVAFRTNSPEINVHVKFGTRGGNAMNTAMLSLAGFDLYMRDSDGRWIWAGNKGYGNGHSGARELTSTLDGTEHECLLYFPLYCEIISCKIGVCAGSTLASLEAPFRHRVVVFGSSYTHGISTSRPGMAYPSQFTRHTGIQMISLGCNGNCKMQPYFADVLCDVEADAFVFDAFSNPPAEMIEERLFPFIEKLQAAHPGVPLIFQQTIYREKRNFDTEVDRKEQAKMDMADSLMKIAVKKYDDVYFIKPNASVKSHESTVDGTHPDDYGYYLWSRSIEKPILRILRKYDIK